MVGEIRIKWRCGDKHGESSEHSYRNRRMIPLHIDIISRLQGPLLTGCHTYSSANKNVGRRFCRSSIPLRNRLNDPIYSI